MNRKLCFMMSLFFLISSISLFPEKKMDEPKGPPIPYIGPWMKSIDIGSIMKKYDIQKDQNMLDLKKLMLPIQDKREEIIKKLVDAAKDIAKKSEIISLTKELFQIEQEIIGINQNFRDKDQQLNKAIEEEMKKTIEDFINKIEVNDQELQLYLNQIIKKDKLDKKNNF
jgi:hypothetical protein